MKNVVYTKLQKKKAPAEKLGFLFMPRKEDRNLGKGIAPDKV